MTPTDHDFLKAVNSTGPTWFESFINERMLKSPDMATVTKNDVLAISACLYRSIGPNMPDRFMDFSAADSALRIEHEDVEMANAIADHFGKQIMMTSLLEKPLSKFQESVQSFLNSDRRSYTDTNKGLIYRLPEFYKYDLDLADLINSHFPNHDKKLCDERLSSIMTLKPLKLMRKNLRSGDKNHYWFKDVDRNVPVMLSLRIDNPLTYIWDHLFSTRSTVSLNGNFNGVKHPSGFEYITSLKWKMEDL